MNLDWIATLATHEDIEGACMAVRLKARRPFYEQEAQALEARAHAIGGARVKATVLFIRQHSYGVQIGPSGVPIYFSN